MLEHLLDLRSERVVAAAHAQCNRIGEPLIRAHTQWFDMKGYVLPRREIAADRAPHEGDVDPPIGKFP